MKPFHIHACWLFAFLFFTYGILAKHCAFVWYYLCLFVLEHIVILLHLVTSISIFDSFAVYTFFKWNKLRFWNCSVLWSLLVVSDLQALQTFFAISEFRDNQMAFDMFLTRINTITHTGKHRQQFYLYVTSLIVSTFI